MKKILIIEDESAYLKLLHEQLTLADYEVLDAENGEEGLNLALTAQPDLILLDILLPKLSGLEMLKALRKNAWGEKVLVFILSNVNESKEISEAMNYNVSKYLVKSEMKLEDLLMSIKVCLK